MTTYTIGSGGDYSTLYNALDDLSSPLTEDVTLKYISDVDDTSTPWGEWPDRDTYILTIDGDGYTSTLDGNEWGRINRDGEIIVKDLTIKGGKAYSGTVKMDCDSASTLCKITFLRCILDTDNEANSRGFLVGSASQNWEANIVNCIIRNQDSGFHAIYDLDGTGEINVENCVLHDTGDGINFDSGTSGSVTNTVTFNCSGTDFNTANITPTYCACEDTSLPDSDGNLRSITPADEFLSLDSSHADYLVPDSTGSIYDSGTEPSLSSTDFDGETWRDPYPIGVRQSPTTTTTTSTTTTSTTPEPTTTSTTPEPTTTSTTPEPTTTSTTPEPTTTTPEPTTTSTTPEPTTYTIGSGGDYSTLANALDGLGSSISEDVVLKYISDIPDAGIPHTSWPDTGSYTLTIDGNGYTVNCSSRGYGHVSPTNGIGRYEIKNLTVIGSGEWEASLHIRSDYNTGVALYLTVDKCIFDADNSTRSRGIYIHGDSINYDIKLTNLIVKNAAFDGIYINSTDGNIDIENCVLHDNEQSGLACTSSVSGTIKNVVSLDNGNSYNAIIANDLTVSYCAVDDTSLPDSDGNLRSITPADEFFSLDSSHVDYLVPDSTGSIYDSGTVPSLSSTDFDGEVWRDPYPIGVRQSPTTTTTTSTTPEPLIFHYTGGKVDHVFMEEGTFSVKLEAERLDDTASRTRYVYVEGTTLEPTTTTGELTTTTTSEAPELPEGYELDFYYDFQDGGHAGDVFGDLVYYYVDADSMTDPQHQENQDRFPIVNDPAGVSGNKVLKVILKKEDRDDPYMPRSELSGVRNYNNIGGNAFDHTYIRYKVFVPVNMENILGCSLQQNWLRPTATGDAEYPNQIGIREDGEGVYRWTRRDPHSEGIDWSGPEVTVGEWVTIECYNHFQNENGYSKVYLNGNKIFDWVDSWGASISHWPEPEEGVWALQFGIYANKIQEQDWTVYFDEIVIAHGSKLTTPEPTTSTSTTEHPTTTSSEPTTTTSSEPTTTTSSEPTTTTSSEPTTTTSSEPTTTTTAEPTTTTTAEGQEAYDLLTESIYGFYPQLLAKGNQTSNKESGYFPVWVHEDVSSDISFYLYNMTGGYGYRASEGYISFNGTDSYMQSTGLQIPSRNFTIFIDAIRRDQSADPGHGIITAIWRDPNTGDEVAIHHRGSDTIRVELRYRDHSYNQLDDTTMGSPPERYTIALVQTNGKLYVKVDDETLREHEMQLGGFPNTAFDIYNYLQLGRRGGWAYCETEIYTYSIFNRALSDSELNFLRTESLAGFTGIHADAYGTDNRYAEIKLD